MDFSTVVLDVGSHSLKAGLGHSKAPSTCIPAIAGKFKYKPVFSSIMQHRPATAIDVLVGKSVEQNKGILHMHYPIRCGVIQDWKSGTLLLKQALDDIFQPNGEKTSLSSSCYYALVETPFASRVQRTRVVESIFEYSQYGEVGGVFAGVSPLLALYSSGQLTGVGLDVGEGQVSTAAAVNGFSIQRAMQREDGGACGESVTAYLSMLLRTYGTCERVVDGKNAGWPVFGSGTVGDLELVRGIKERRCEVSPHRLSAETTVPSTAEALDDALGSAAAQHQLYPPKVHRLPDGTELAVGVEALLAPEVLFDPSLIGSEGSGIAELVFRAVAQADLDARPLLLSHLMVSGGTTLLNGFGGRFLNEMLQRVPRENKVRVVAPAERAFAPWLGAAFLSQLSTFKTNMVISKQEYDESGEAAIQQRLFA